MAGLPRAELEELAGLRRSHPRLAGLRAEALRAAAEAGQRPFLAETLGTLAQRNIPLWVGEPSLMESGVWEGEDVPGVSACILPLDCAREPHQWILGPASRRAWLRSCLVGDETEILEAAAFGFSGAALPLAGKDQYEAQYLVELARDLRMTLVPLVESDADLALVLGTDAPYVGFGGITLRSPEGTLSHFRASVAKLPRGMCALVHFWRGASDVHCKIACDLGAAAVIRPAPGIVPLK